MFRAVLAAFLLRSALGLQQQPDAAVPADSMPAWMSPLEDRPWGKELSIDEREDKAAEEIKAKERELKEASAQHMRNSLSNNIHQAEMQVDASSDMEGFAEPLNETQAEDMADAWQVIQGSDVTFSYSTYCDPVGGCKNSGHKHGQPSFQEMHRNVLASLRALRFCFSNVLLILDSPHVGHDKMGPETPGNVTSHTVNPSDITTGLQEMRIAEGANFKAFRVDSGLTTAAQATAKSAAELLRDHCPLAAPLWQVKVVDYASPEVKKRALEHYNIPELVQNTSFFEKMYMNTMALDENFQAKSKYVFYIDAQKRLYRSNFSRNTPNFIQKAVSLMKSDSRVYLASVMNTFNLEPQRNQFNKFAVIPGSVHGSSPVERVKGMLQGWSAEQWLSSKRPLRGEAFHPKLENPSDEDFKRTTLYRMNWDGWGTIVTHHNFLMDTERFKSLFPLDSWDTAVEHMWSANMNKKFPDRAVQIYFNETVGVFAGPSEA